MISSRSAHFKPGMPGKSGINSEQNSFSLAKPLIQMPDYSNETRKDIEKALGPFQYDEDESQYGDKLISRGPYQLENGAVYHGSWSEEG